jgi:hypothetical protein
MRALLGFILAILVSLFKSRSRLEAENAALRHQLIVLRRQAGRRIRLTNGDRLFFVQLDRWFPSIMKVISPITPDYRTPETARARGALPDPFARAASRASHTVVSRFVAS